MDIPGFLMPVGIGVGSLVGTFIYVRKYYMPIKEVYELVLEIAHVMEDGKITKAELAHLVNEVSDVKNAIKRLKNT